MLMRMTGRLDEKKVRAAGKISDNLVAIIEKEIEKSKFEISDVQVPFSRPRNSSS